MTERLDVEAPPGQGLVTCAASRVAGIFARLAGAHYARPPRWIDGVGVRLAVRSAEAHHRFYGDVLGLERVGDAAYAWGGTRLFFDEDASLPSDMITAANAHMRAPGLRYLTVQVTDVDRVHRELVERGALEGFAPMTLGAVARISFIRDPDGNWIEISQRASLTGSLDPS